LLTNLTHLILTELAPAACFSGIVSDRELMGREIESAQSISSKFFEVKLVALSTEADTLA
jgi:hypothetical protein